MDIITVNDLSIAIEIKLNISPEEAISIVDRIRIRRQRLILKGKYTSMILVWK